MIGLGIIAYFIYKYKNNEQQGSLLSEKKESPIDKLENDIQSKDKKNPKSDV